jgi:hypothetical protein
MLVAMNWLICLQILQFIVGAFIEIERERFGTIVNIFFDIWVDIVVVEIVELVELLVLFEKESQIDS